MTKSTVRLATPEEINDWDAYILKNPDNGSVFASKEYAEIKRLTAYTPLFLFVGPLAVTVLEKKTFPLGKLWYLPKNPGVTKPETLLSVLDSLKSFAKNQGVFAVRVESELPKSDAPQLEQSGLQAARPIIPNASTILLDISPDEETLLTSLPQKGRHAIRRAERDGVTIQRVPATEENAQKMYALLAETAEGQFGIRSYNYYKTYWETFEKAGFGQLFFAYYEGSVVAGAYAMTFGTKSTYKDGASVRQRTAYGASHLLQWEVIRWAKESGSVLHDFCGSPPSDQINNPDHPHYGIGRFKLSLSKNVIDYIGCYDLVVSDLRYTLWQKGLERAHKSVYLRKTGDFYY